MIEAGTVRIDACCVYVDGHLVFTVVGDRSAYGEASTSSGRLVSALVFRSKQQFGSVSVCPEQEQESGWEEFTVHC